MYSKHYDMWVFKIPASSTGSLTVKNPGPELAEGRSRRAFVILANAGIHSLQLVSLWIAAYAGMTEK